jgi:hypothetical protein
LDLDDDLFTAVQGRVVHLRDRCRSERLVLEGLEEVAWLVAELLLEQLVHFVFVGRRDRVEQAAELAGHRFAECARAGRDDLAELDVRRPEIGERLRDLLEDLLLERAFAGEVGDDPRAGPGYLPTRGADAGGLDRQRHPVQLGHLAVLSRTHGLQSLKVWGIGPNPCGPGHSSRSPTPAVEHNAQNRDIARYTASAHKRAIVAADP